MARICIAGGAGYVGLITGVGLAALGNDVICVDVNRKRLSALASGSSHILEEGLEDLLAECLERGRITFSSDLGTSSRLSNFVFIAVGTPSESNGDADLSQVIEVAEEIAGHIEQYTVVVLKSTVPVGTAETVRDVLRREHEEGVEFDIVSNPEFLAEGRGLRDFFSPERIVVGADSRKALDAMQKLYAPITARTNDIPALSRVARNAPPQMMATDLASAQLIKYASNAFLATRISFINEIAGLCERLGADISAVADGMGMDTRIGRAYLDAGLGFGGPCLEKDLTALIHVAEGNGFDPMLLRSVLDRNDRQLNDVVGKLEDALVDGARDKTVAVLGLAFKPGTNDVRTSLSIRVIDLILEAGAHVRACDPVAVAEAREIRPTISYFEDPYVAATGAQALMVLTDWPQYASLDYGKLLEAMDGNVIIDTRNLLDSEAASKAGFDYVGIGGR
jgi:UDPglucose 6-dehydrogenase